LSQSSFGRQRFDVEAPRTADIGPRGPVLRYSNHFLVRRSRVGPSGTLQIGEKIEPGLPTTRIGTTNTRTRYDALGRRIRQLLDMGRSSKQDSLEPS
jgi:YD repeat-containing protein